MVEGEVRAFEEVLGRSVEAVMRRISGVAAHFDAVLEVRVVRDASVRTAFGGAAPALVRDLSEAGFAVWTEDLWLPAPEGDVWLGVGERGEEPGESLAEFLGSHSDWEVV